MIETPDSAMTVQLNHQYKVDVPLSFLPKNLKVQLDVFLHETVTFDHFEVGDDDQESELTPYPHSAGYGQGSHIEEDGLEEEERDYFGCISNRWEHHISAPPNIVVGIQDGASVPVENRMAMSRPFGSSFDYELGSLALNPDITVEKIIYCSENDPEYSLQDLPQELGGEPEIRTAYVHRMAEMFAANLARRTDLQFMHPEADRLYKIHCRKMMNQNLRSEPNPGGTVRRTRSDNAYRNQGW